LAAPLPLRRRLLQASFIAIFFHAVSPCASRYGLLSRALFWMVVRSNIVYNTVFDIIIIIENFSIMMLSIAPGGQGA
jgi:hypothetical protein